MNTDLSINAQRITVFLEVSQTWPVTHLLLKAKAIVSRESLDRIIPKNIRIVVPLLKLEFKPTVPGA